VQVLDQQDEKPHRREPLWHEIKASLNLYYCASFLHNTRSPNAPSPWWDVSLRVYFSAAADDIFKMLQDGVCGGGGVGGCTRYVRGLNERHVRH
jgi:hypothetical protein